MTGHHADAVQLPPPPALGTVDHALWAARRCTCHTGTPRPAPLPRWAAVLGHACGVGPFEARPGERPGLRGHLGETRVTAGGNTPIRPGSYAYEPVAHQLVPARVDHARTYDGALALHLDDDTGETAACVRLVAAACGLCTHAAGPDTLLLYASTATTPASGGMEDALAALPVEPPVYTAALGRLTASDLLTLLHKAAPDPPYRVTVRSVDGMDAGVYRADVAQGPLEPVWHGPTAPYAHVLTRGGHPAAAALADAAAIVHLVGGHGTPRAADALRVRVAASAAGLAAWCDDAATPAATALLGLIPGVADVTCHITIGHARPEPRLRIPVRLATSGALP
ncbi:hypothetical protein [Streptomyces milbemycinicus]|uniref:hypothetical protein n=1 Tax=Streptomyces milbemycinicus TaxID=476552 RepID=UPI00340DC9D4